MCRFRYRSWVFGSYSLGYRLLVQWTAECRRNKNACANLSVDIWHLPWTHYKRYSAPAPRRRDILYGASLWADHQHSWQPLGPTGVQFGVLSSTSYIANHSRCCTSNISVDSKRELNFAISIGKRPISANSWRQNSALVTRRKTRCEPLGHRKL